jgi:hypothetical protein
VEARLRTQRSSRFLLVSYGTEVAYPALGLLMEAADRARQETNNLPWRVSSIPMVELRDMKIQERRGSGLHGYEAREAGSRSIIIACFAGAADVAALSLG